MTTSDNRSSAFETNAMAAEQQREEQDDALKKANEGIEENDSRWKIKAVNVRIVVTFKFYEFFE